VRVDTGVREGDAISPHYDSMIAKLIVWGEDRAQALARLDAALAETHINGLQHNVAFLRRCAATQSFAGADLDTGLIERERAALFGQPGLPLDIAAAGVLAHTLALEAAQQDADPWSARDGWRLAGDAVRRFDLVDATLGDTHHEVLLRRRHRGGMELVVAGQSQAFAVQSDSSERHTLILGEGLAARRLPVHTYARGEQVTVFAPQGSATLTEVDVIARAGAHVPSGGRLTAPMPGKLIALHVKAGDTVKTGQPLAVMEAMKMEHAINAPRDGVVAELLYAVGDQLSDGAELLRLQ
jgi:3-methylcrotonyl-CoA carboxylase alpha subunit